MDQNQQVKLDAKKVLNLLDNQDFIDIVMDGFIKSGSMEQVMYQNLDNSKTLDELKARQILHNYLFGILSYAEKLGD